MSSESRRTATAPCPACGASASGRFCSECGAALSSDATCAGCRRPLTPGARFCQHCGTPVGGGVAAMPAAAVGGRSSALPWAIVAIALVALIGLIAGQQFGKRDQTLPADDNAAFAPFAGGNGAASAGPVSAGDISRMSPRERADRLFDRIMRLSSEGKADSVQFFAPMALSVYETLGPLDDDLRYDFGRVAEAAGRTEIARAQADTILRGNPNHLLGLALAMRAAAADGDATRQREFAVRLLAAQPTEAAKQLEEYTRHQSDIDTALQEARKVK